MPAAQFTEVITGPARRASAAGRRLTVEPALADRLLTDSSEGADALPLLALSLERLYCDYGAEGALTMAGYEEMGGMSQVVQSEVDKLLDPEPDLRQAQLDILHDAFIPWLATVNPDNDQPMRRLARYGDLPATSHDLIDAFVDKRLLVKDTREGRTVVEVALESLLRQWRELAAWLRAEAQELKDADALEHAAADWQTSGGDPAWLLEGTRLTEAESLAAKPGFRDRLNLTRDYISASRTRENDRVQAEKHRQEAELQRAKQHAAALRKRSRILVALLTATVVIAVVAVILGLLGYNASKQADARFRDETSLRLVSEANAMLAGTDSGGDVRAIQELLAARTITTPDDGQLLHAAAIRSSTLKIMTTGYPVNSVAFSPDGHRLVSAGDDDLVRIRDASTGQALQTLTAHTDSVTSVAFSPDGHHLASGSADNTVRLWNVDTRQPLQMLTGHKQIVTSVVFSPDGHRLASGSADGTVRIWDVDRGRHPQTLDAHAGAVYGVAFSPDGHRLASASHDNKVRLWDADTNQLLRTLSGHTDIVSECRRSVRRPPARHRQPRRNRPTVGCRHRSTTANAERLQQLRQHCGVQPRRAPPSLWQRRQHRATVGCRHGPAAANVASRANAHRPYQLRE